MRQESLTGLERLIAVTKLLHRIRLQEPRDGVWDAADLQWWWRRPRASDEVALPVWFDDADQPVAAAVLTTWPHAWQLDIIRLPGGPLTLEDLTELAWAYLESMEGPPVIESLVLADDVELGAWFAGRGFSVAGESWSGWQAAADRPAVEALPAGYQLVDRAVRGVEVAPEHPMVGRNGPNVEARLRQTSLYDPRLDLAVLAADESVAGYALFWHDPGYRRRAGRAGAGRGRARQPRDRVRDGQRRPGSSGKGGLYLVEDWLGVRTCREAVLPPRVCRGGTCKTYRRTAAMNSGSEISTSMSKGSWFRRQPAATTTRAVQLVR